MEKNVIFLKSKLFLVLVFLNGCAIGPNLTNNTIKTDIYHQGSGAVDISVRKIYEAFMLNPFYVGHLYDQGTIVNVKMNRENNKIVFLWYAATISDKDLYSLMEFKDMEDGKTAKYNIYAKKSLFGSRLDHYAQRLLEDLKHDPIILQHRPLWGSCGRTPKNVSSDLRAPLKTPQKML